MQYYDKPRRAKSTDAVNQTCFGWEMRDEAATPSFGSLTTVSKQLHLPFNFPLFSPFFKVCHRLAQRIKDDLGLGSGTSRNIYLIYRSSYKRLFPL